MWLEIMKDYQFDIQYHPGKANVFADALSRRSKEDLATTWKAKWSELRHNDEITRAYMVVLAVTPEIIMRVVRAQADDPLCQDRVKQLLAEGADSYSISSEGGLRFNGRLVVPEDEDLRHAVMMEAHISKFMVHPGGYKMYQYMRMKYWWTWI